METKRATRADVRQALIDYVLSVLHKGREENMGVVERDPATIRQLDGLSPMIHHIATWNPTYDDY